MAAGHSYPFDDRQRHDQARSSEVASVYSSAPPDSAFAPNHHYLSTTDFTSSSAYMDPPSPQDCKVQNYAAEPLLRYASSGGSSQASMSTSTSPVNSRLFSYPSTSVPESTTSMQYPYNWADFPSTYQYPANFYAIDNNTSLLDQMKVAGSTSKDRNTHWPVCCLAPDCKAKPFKRRADFDRHYKHRHAPDSKREAYYCDWRRCARRRDPFYRRDHYRDHLREFHREDIEKRGGVVDKAWLEGRNLSSDWWRCSRCLQRVEVGRHGYECPRCKTICQARRKEARQ